VDWACCTLVRVQQQGEIRAFRRRLHWEGRVSCANATSDGGAHLGLARKGMSCPRWSTWGWRSPEGQQDPAAGDTLDPACVVVDVITNPRITPFLATARQRGSPVVDGVEMLVQLAMQIFQQWTGITPEEDVFQRAVAEALGETPAG